MWEFHRDSDVRFGPHFVRLAPNEPHLALLKTVFSKFWLIFKNTTFVQFGANMTQIVSRSTKPQF